MITYTAYRLGLDIISGDFTHAIARLLQLFFATDKSTDSRRAFVSSAYPVLETARVKNYNAGVALIHSEARRVGLDPASIKIPEIVPYNEAILDITINGLTGGTNTATFSDVMSTLVQHVEAPARILMADLADPSPETDTTVHPGDAAETFAQDVLLSDAEKEHARQAIKNEAAAKVKSSPRERYKFARVLTGKDNCAFCVMLASRGPVFSSEKRAGSQLDGTEYHRRCDCIAVPVLLNDFPAQAQADQLFEIWNKAQEKNSSTGTSNDALNNLRQYLTVNPVEVPDLRRQSDHALAA